LGPDDRIASPVRDSSVSIQAGAARDTGSITDTHIAVKVGANPRVSSGQANVRSWNANIRSGQTNRVPTTLVGPSRCFRGGGDRGVNIRPHAGLPTLRSDLDRAAGCTLHALVYVRAYIAARIRCNAHRAARRTRDTLIHGCSNIRSGASRCAGCAADVGIGVGAAASSDAALASVANSNATAALTSTA
jgi:hypothetical protein